MNILDVHVSQLKEWSDNPVKRSRISDKELSDSIKAYGVKQPLTVVLYNGGYLVVDGNRRLRIAKKQGIESLPVVVCNNDDPVALAITLNTTVRAWDQQTVGQLVASHPEAAQYIPDRYKNLVGCMRLLGDDYLAFIREYGVNAYNVAIRLAKYLGRYNDKEFCKKVVLWVAKHKMIRLARNVVDSKQDGSCFSKFEEAIELDKPIVLKMEIGEVGIA